MGRPTPSFPHCRPNCVHATRLPPLAASSVASPLTVLSEALDWQAPPGPAQCGSARPGPAVLFVLLFTLEPPCPPLPSFFPWSLFSSTDRPQARCRLVDSPYPFLFPLPTSTFAFLTTVTPLEIYSHSVHRIPFTLSGFLLPNFGFLFLFFSRFLVLTATLPTPHRHQPPIPVNQHSIQPPAPSIGPGRHSFASRRFPYRFLSFIIAT